MKIRFAAEKDIGFLIAGLERNRVLEKRQRKDVPARNSDKEEFKKAIKNRCVRVVEESSEPVAFLYFRTDFKVMYLNDRFFWVDLIYVKEKYRGRGIGKLLYKDAIRIAKKKGFKTLIIDIFDFNTNSVEFHKKLGFKPIYTIYKKKI